MMESLADKIFSYLEGSKDAGYLDCMSDLTQDILHIIRDYVEKMDRWCLQWESMSLNKYGDYLDYVEVMEALGWKE